MSRPDTSDRGDLLRGTLEMLILRSLSREALHGYAISESILSRSDQVLEIDEGSLYPALYRMQQRGWIRGRWGKSENNRRAKFYELTDEGRSQLDLASHRWERFSGAVGRVMEGT